MAREVTDYEKQYQEDLERAQALSLESLALEQFKSKRLQEIHHGSVKNKNVSSNFYDHNRYVIDFCIFP